MTLPGNQPEPDRRQHGSRRQQRAVCGASVLGLLLLAACSTTPPGHRAGLTGLPQGSYAALGDSYTSGPDIPDQVGTPAGCDRSDRSYPALVVKDLKLTASQVRDVSCSGATVADLTAPQSTSNGTNPAQLSALTAETSLVTIGIGGNDIDFSAILTRCVELDAPGTIIDQIRHATSTLSLCRGTYTAGGTDQIRQKIQAASAQLATALTRIRELAPHAAVYVVGYPDLLPPAGGEACSRSLGITPGDITYLNNEELNLNRALKQQAEAVGDAYVDTYTPSVGHDACSGASTRWIEPLLPDAPAAPMHPNAAGEQHMAIAVEDAIAAGQP